jgi:hypothetical protein
MSGMAETHPLPARLALVLLVCTASLAAHFIFETFGTTAQRTLIETLEHGGSFDPLHTQAEESFLFPDPVPAATVVLSVRVPQADACRRVCLPSSPLLPPPKAH